MQERLSKIVTRIVFSRLEGAALASTNKRLYFMIPAVPPCISNPFQATHSLLCPLDGLLWRSYRGRFLRVVRSDDEVREILTRYHDNNNHAGRTRAVKEIMVSLEGFI